MELEKAWKITEFSSLIGQHHNTVDQWFKQLEDKRIHYVNRILGQKVYDQLDLDIGRYIKEGREKNYNLQVIFEQLPDVYELRLFPPDWSTGDSQLVDIDAMRRMMETRLQESLAEMREGVLAEAVRIFEDKQKLLPKPKSAEEERADRVNDMLTRFSIERKLEDEAIQKWASLPESDRMRKVGLFRKDEDWGKRDAFIRRYVQENIEQAIKNEYGIGL